MWLVQGEELDEFLLFPTTFSLTHCKIWDLVKMVSEAIK